MRLTNREPNLFEKREQINPIKKPDYLRWPAMLLATLIFVLVTKAIF